MARLLVFSGLMVLVMGFFARSEPARVNVWTAGGGLVVWGFVIRYQHVKLW